MTVLGFLYNLRPARRRRRQELLEFIKWDKTRTKVDRECPHCHFISPTLEGDTWMVCGWCLEAVVLSVH